MDEGEGEEEGGGAEGGAGPGGEEGERVLASFGDERAKAQALACKALAASRKRPLQAGTAEEAAALLLPPSRRVCLALAP